MVATVTAIYRRMFIEGGRIYPTAPLKQLCSKIGSGATPKGGKTAYQESGVSLVRSTNVFDYAFSYDDLAHISDEQADQLSNVIVEENDVLFNITGVSVTRCCIVPADVLPARVNQHVMILRPKTAMPMSYYIMTTLCSAENKGKLRESPSLVRPERQLTSRKWSLSQFRFRPQKKYKILRLRRVGYTNLSSGTQRKLCG